MFVLSGALAVLARIFKQPLILAYLATGAIISYFGFVDVVGKDIFQVFSDLGIMFLLFLVGLEINYASLRLVGKTSLIVGLGQILLTTLGGYGLARWLNFDTMSSLYIAIALTFSSTIIIIKLLSDKRDLNSLYGKISVGLLLVQDIVAILIIVILSGIATSNNFSYLEIGLTLGKAIILFGLAIVLGRKILPHLFDEIAHSQELLFLISTAWVLLIATVVHKLGFSIEIAGFLAGISLANSSENYQIANRIRPLRDFFILVFFIILGASFAHANFSGLGVAVVVLSLFVLIGQPIIMLVIMGLLGFKKRTSFLAGLTVAQVSEFSLILAALGLKVGHIKEGPVALITIVAVVTIIISSYLIVHGNALFRIMRNWLWIFEKKRSKDILIPKENKKGVILIGYHRTGESLAHYLPTKDLIIVDFDPEVTKRLEHSGREYIFGDISDPEIFDQIVSYKTRLVISTTPDPEDNFGLIHRLKKLRKRPGIVVRADTESDALQFYAAGADYVLVPHLASGHQLGKMLSSHSHLQELRKLRFKDIAYLKRDLT